VTIGPRAAAAPVTTGRFSPAGGRLRPAAAAAARDNGPVLRVANWAVRAVLVVLAGVVTFTVPWPSRTFFVLEVAAFCVCTLLLAGCTLVDRSGPFRNRFGFLLPWLLGAVAVIGAITGTGGALIVLAMVAVLQAGSQARLLAGWLACVAGVIGALASGLAFGASFWGVTIGHSAFLLLLFLLGLNRREHRVQAEQATALLARSEQLRAEQAQVATLSERARIAREIHDVLAHSLGALGLQIQAARAVLTDSEDVPRAVELLDQAQRIAADGLGETRRAVHALRGDTLPLPDGLAELSASHQRQHGTRVTFEVSGEPRSLTPDVRLAFARTAQEALVNTAKHAPHEPVRMRLDYTEADTCLEVTNHLAEGGAAATAGDLATVNGGFGLAGMRERLLLLDGTLSAGRDGTNWVVVARVPR
jgi:signal transduction histidine kinase